MKVVGHGPHAWYLLEHEASHLLLARCSRGPTEFDILLRLNAEEFEEYRALGHVYIHYLAARVDNWSSEYWPRHEAALQSDASAAVAAYIAARVE